jgi:NodT family efflux transporter outer membrane factor (OMF) lipoprotein
VLACGLLALGGCAVGPKYVEPPVAVNHEWKETGDPHLTVHATPDSAWWRAFGDATLDSLVRIAYHQNLPLQAAGLRILAARAQLGIATGRQYPQIQAVTGHATAIGLPDYVAKGINLDRNFWEFQVGFDAAWELDFWRKYGQGVKAEEASYLATVADYDNALVSLTAEVARTYAMIRTFEVLVDQTRANAAVQQEGQRIATSRFRNGATSELDVTQATTLLESTRSLIPQLESDLQQSKNALCTLLGRATGSLDTLLARSQGIPAPPDNVALSAPAQMLRRRPDIRSAELQAIAQCDRIGVAKADLYPSLALFGSIGTQSASGATPPYGGITFPTLFGSGSWFYTLGPRLVWPLFNYGRIQNNARLQDARLQELLVSYRQSVLKAAQEVEDGMSGYLKAQEATGSAEKATAGAQRSLDLAFIQYREGAVDFQRVLDAQRSLLAQQNSLAQTRSAVATNLIGLYKALGGGWEMRIGQPLVPDSTRIEMQNRTNWGNYFSTPPADQTSNGSSATPR